MISISNSLWPSARQVHWEPNQSLPPVDNPAMLSRAAEELTATREARQTASISASSSSSGADVHLSLSQEAKSALSSGSMQLSISSEASTGKNASQSLNIQMTGETSSTVAVIGFNQDGSIYASQGETVADAYQFSATVSLSDSSLQMDTYLATTELVSDGELQQLKASILASSLNVQDGSSQSSAQQSANKTNL